MQTTVEEQHGIELARTSIQSNIQKMEQPSSCNANVSVQVKKKGSIDDPTLLLGIGEESDDESALWGVEHMYAGSGGFRHKKNQNQTSVIEKFSTACPSHLVASTMCICFMVVMTLLGMVIFQATERYTLLNERYTVLNERYTVLNNRLTMLENRSYSFSFLLNHTK